MMGANKYKLPKRLPANFSFLACLVLGAVVVTLYSVSWGHNFLFDEEKIILKNPLIQDWHLIPRIFQSSFFFYERGVADLWSRYYRPLVSLTFMADYFFWKANPLGYNLTNTALHGLVVVFLYQILARMLNDPKAAFLSAMLFAVHTVHTEAVTYIASRGDLVAAVLILMAIFAYWKDWYWVSVVSYIFALFSKESALLLPCYLGLLDVCFLKNSFRTRLVRFSVFLFTAVLFLFLRNQLLPVPFSPPLGDPKMALLRVLSMGGAWLDYFRALTAPEPFKFCMTVSFADRFLDSRVFLTLVLMALTALAWWRAFQTRGAAFFGLSFFLIALLPSSQIIHFHPEWAEHYLYIPSIGLAVLMGSFFKQVSKTKSRLLIFAVLALWAFFIFFWSIRTVQRNLAYTDAKGFYEKLSTSDSPYAYIGYQNLAGEAMSDGHWEQAIAFLKASQGLKPGSDVTQNMFGLYYLNKNDFGNALKYFEKACVLRAGDLRYQMNMAYTLIRQGDYPKAIQILEAAQQKAPEYPAVYLNLLPAYELSGDALKAKEWAEKGRDALKGRDHDQVLMTWALVRLAYRQGWDKQARHYAAEIVDRYAEQFWYTDLARLIDQRIDLQQFEILLRSKYSDPSYETISRPYILMSLVLGNQQDAAHRFYESHRKVFDAMALDDPTSAKELSRATVTHER